MSHDIRFNMIQNKPNDSILLQLRFQLERFKEMQRYLEATQSLDQQLVKNRYSK